MIDALIQQRRNRDLSIDDLLSVGDLSDKDIDLIFELTTIAESILTSNERKCSLLKGITQFNFFLEPSTRTRTGFELAWKNLWADVVNLSSTSSSMSKGETLLDTIQTLGALKPDLIVVRSPTSWAPHFIASNSCASVINAWDWWNEHPTQWLLCLYTITKFLGKGLKWKKIVIVGDTMHSRVFGSLIRMTQRFWMNVIVSAPCTLIQNNLEQFWAKIEYNLDKAIEWADIIYTLRLQTERASWSFVSSWVEYSNKYIINERRLNLASPSAIVMHPWPVMRNFDIHEKVLSDTRCKILDQVSSWYAIRFILLWLFWSKSKKYSQSNLS